MKCEREEERRESRGENREQRRESREKGQQKTQNQRKRQKRKSKETKRDQRWKRESSQEGKGGRDEGREKRALISVSRSVELGEGRETQPKTNKKHHWDHEGEDVFKANSRCFHYYSTGRKTIIWKSQFKMLLDLITRFINKVFLYYTNIFFINSQIVSILHYVIFTHRFTKIRQDFWTKGKT